MWRRNLEDISEFEGKWYDSGQFRNTKNYDNWLELKSNKTFVWESSDGEIMVSGKFKIGQPVETEFGSTGKKKTYWSITFYNFSGKTSSMWDENMTIYDTPRENYINGLDESSGISYNFSRNRNSLRNNSSTITDQSNNNIEVKDKTDLKEERAEEVSDKNELESDEIIEFFRIEDPDGWSNLRKTPAGEVLRKVYSDEKFEVIGEENKHKKVKLSDGTIGFIHNSRVVSF